MRVLIGPMSSPAGKLGIERLLKREPGGAANSNIVDLIDDWPTVLGAVARGAEDSAQRYDVLIAEFRLPGSPTFAAINAADPAFSVIDVDLVRGTSNTPMFDVDSEKLLRLAEWLTREAGLTSTAAQVADLARHLPAGEAGAEPPAWPRPVPPPPPPADAEAERADLARWLALKLGLRLAETEAEVPRQDFPGWAMSAQRARALLGVDIAALSPRELADAWQEVDRRLEARIEAAGQDRPDGALASVCRSFRLDRIEREMLWFALAPDMAGCFAQAIGFLNDDLMQRRPSLSLLSQLIDGAGPPWQLQRRLTGDGALAGLRLVSLVRADPLVPESEAPLIVAPDLAALLLGARPGEGIEGATLYDPVDFAGEAFDLQVAPVLQAARAAGRDGAALPIVHLHAGAAEAGWLAAQLASVGEHALVGDISTAGAALPERLLAFARTARAVDGVLIVAGADALDEPRRAELTRALARMVAPQVRLLAVQGMKIDTIALRGAGGGVMEISRPRPTREERAAIWTRAGAGRGLALPPDGARELAATFAFDRAQAETAIALALGSGAVEPSEAGGEALRDAARIVSRASAPPAVRRIETGLGWDDLVLPAPVKAELKSIASQIRHATTVWEKWGFGDRIPYGQGMIALLAGPSGTGKTMAAQIIAGELGAALFQLDLAKTVSKFIGETEKMLDRIFEAAQSVSAVLLFDEADALFGKRSDIHDAHDRYANIEVDYLLQRIEEHVAPVLLTTNRKANIDPAFLRRLNKVIDFPMPDDGQRAEIWRRMFPPEAPLAADVDTVAFSHLPLSGGGIVNSVLNAAFIAAEDGGVIQMRHLVAGARSELAKSGMESAGRGLAHLIGGARAAGGEK